MQIFIKEPFLCALTKKYEVKAKLRLKLRAYPSKDSQSGQAKRVDHARCSVCKRAINNSKEKVVYLVAYMSMINYVQLFVDCRYIFHLSKYFLLVGRFNFHILAVVS